jgi:SulP family sulfate permease
MILFVIRQSNTVRVKRWDLSDPGVVIESDPPATVPPNEVVVLQPYGTTFFAAAPVFERSLPEVTAGSGGSVVIVRLRGHDDLGSTFAQVLLRYAESLAAVGSKLVIVSASALARRQLDVTGTTAAVGESNVYAGDERVGAAVRLAYDDALIWIQRSAPADGAS